MGHIKGLTEGEEGLQIFPKPAPGSWTEAFQWVLLGLFTLGLNDSMNEWRDVFPRWIAKRRKRRAER